jgi:hypothetical protein
LSVIDAPALACAFVLALANGENLPLLGAVAGPAFAAALQSRFSRAIAPAVAVAASAAIVYSIPRTSSPPPIPAGAIERLAASRTPHLLFCAPVEWCSWATVRGAHRVRIFVDGRLEDYSRADLDVQTAIADVRRDWRELVERNHIDAILVERRHTLAGLLALDRRWSGVAAGNGAVLFVKNPQ